MSDINILLQNPDEVSTTFTALLSSAIHDESPEYTLADLSQAVQTPLIASQIDALHAIESLAALDGPDSRSLLKIIGLEASAKEVVLAVQERVEHLERLAEVESEGSSDGENASTASEGSDKLITKHATHSAQLVILVSLYSDAIPRLTLRKKNTFETLQPLLSDLDSAISAIAPSSSIQEGRELIKAICELIQSVYTWLTNVESDPDTKEKTQAILRHTLDMVVTAAAGKINASLAARAFLRVNPRLAIPGRPVGEKGWEEGAGVLHRAASAGETLGLAATAALVALARSPTTGMLPLILLAHCPPSNLRVSPLETTILSPLMPLVAVSLAPGAPTLDYALCILIYALLSPPPSQPSQIQIQPALYLDVSLYTPLFALLPPLASLHPHAPTRHITLRLLSATLRLVPPIVRLDTLADLVGPTCPYPQLRAAGVGLVREAVMEGLSMSEGDGADGEERTVFASPRIFNALPGLFAPSEEFDTLFSSLSSRRGPSEDAISHFLTSPEPTRLTEVLGLYFIILKRDVGNSTGVRSASRLNAVREALLDPLARFIDTVLGLEHNHEHEHESARGEGGGGGGHEHSHEHEHGMRELALVPLQTALLRVQDALQGGREA